MFIAMNQFQVSPSRIAEFEEIWCQRESYLAGAPGFRHFALLKGDDPGDYISHSTWDSRDAFLQWTRSVAFERAHGTKMPEGVLAGHPRARFYEAVLEEDPSARQPQ